MHVDIWIAIVVAAIGTYALRVVPLLWTQRHFNKHKANNTEARLPTWLSVLGPLMIAAMLGASLIPKAPSCLAQIQKLRAASVLRRAFFWCGFWYRFGLALGVDVKLLG